MSALSPRQEFFSGNIAIINVADEKTAPIALPSA